MKRLALVAPEGGADAPYDTLSPFADTCPAYDLVDSTVIAATGTRLPVGVGEKRVKRRN